MKAKSELQEYIEGIKKAGLGDGQADVAELIVDNKILIERADMLLQ